MDRPLEILNEVKKRRIRSGGRDAVTFNNKLDGDDDKMNPTKTNEEQIVRTVCSSHCGGACEMKVHISGGRNIPSIIAMRVRVTWRLGRAWGPS